MRKFFIFKLIVIIVLIFISKPSLSQELSELKDLFNCDKVLVSTKINHTLTVNEYCHLLSLVNQENFEVFKNTWGGSGGLGIPGLITLNLDADYAKFSQNRAKYFRLRKFVHNRDVAINTIASYLPKNVSTEWSNCQQRMVDSIGHLSEVEKERIRAEIEIKRMEIENLRIQTPGIKISIIKQTLRNVLIRVQWTPPTYFTATGKILFQELSGGTTKGLAEGSLLPANLEFTNAPLQRIVSIERSPGQEIVFTLTVGTDSFSFTDGDIIETMDATTTLFSAVNTGNFDLASEAIRMGANINATSIKSLTPLMIASRDGHYRIVELLLRQPSININAQASLGETALYLAVDKPYLPVIEKLLKNGADPNVAINNIKYKKGEFYGWTPLNFACYLYYAYDKGPKVTEPSATTKKANYLDAIKLLRNGKGKINFKRNLRRWLFITTSNGQLEELRYMINSGQNVNRYIDDNKNNCLHLAAERCHTDIVRYLLGVPNINLNYENSFGDTPLKIAEARCGNNSEVTNLIRRAVSAQ